MEIVFDQRSARAKQQLFCTFSVVVFVVGALISSNVHAVSVCLRLLKDVNESVWAN